MDDVSIMKVNSVEKESKISDIFIRMFLVWLNLVCIIFFTMIYGYILQEFFKNIIGWIFIIPFASFMYIPLMWCLCKDLFYILINKTQRKRSMLRVPPRPKHIPAPSRQNKI
jgi:hypothetical protein